MKAILLAAGSGTRLRGLIPDRPKCMVHVDGRPILEWQFSALLAVGVREIAIVTGFRAEVLRDYVATTFPGASVTFIHNHEYAKTNNMYSLWLARDFAGSDDLLFMNADVVFDPGVLARLMASPVSAIAVDEGSYNEESMKVIRSAADGWLTAISKEIGPTEAHGSSIDVYRLTPPDARLLFAECDRIIEEEQQRRQWSEVALHRLLESGRLRMVSVNVAGLPWYEIDNPDDLAAAELLFAAADLRARLPRAWLVDLDGTLYLGTEPIAGAAEFVRSIRASGARVVFLSNNSSKSHTDYVRHLTALGIECAEGDILLSTDALGEFLQTAGLHKVFVLGTESMKRVLARYGVEHETNEPAAVVLGYHNQVNYDELAAAALLLRDSHRPYFASHLDRVCPTERGPIPDAGALAELLFVATGRRPERVFGKPDPAFILGRLARLGAIPGETVIVGDRVYTDYALARAAGTRFVGVLSGESTRRDFEGLADILVVPSVGELVAAWKADGESTVP